MNTYRQRVACYLVIGTVGLFSGCAQEARPPVETVKGTNWYVEGALAYQQGDQAKAIQSLQSALQENPNLIMARFLLGGIYRDKGQYAAAAEQYERVVELDPYVYTNYYNLGLMYHLLSRLQEATTNYLAALRLNPTDVKSNMYLGMVYTALGKADAGLPYVKKAAELDPKFPDAQANLAVVLDTLGEYSAAETAYRRALELDSNRTETAINLAGCLVAQKRYSEANSVYENIIKAKDSSLVRQRYGSALLAAGRINDAVREFNTAIRMNGRNYYAYNGLAEAMVAEYRKSTMLDEGKRAEAIRYWKHSLELNPNQPRISAAVKEYSEGNLFP